MIISCDRIKFKKIAKMRGLVLIVCLGITHAYAQQAIDPAYLRQYYQQIAQQAGASQQRSHEATPVYEPPGQEQQLSQQYVQQPQQIRVKDNVNDQVGLNRSGNYFLFQRG